MNRVKTLDDLLGELLVLKLEHGGDVPVGYFDKYYNWHEPEASTSKAYMDSCGELTAFSSELRNGQPNQEVQIVTVRD